MSISVDGFVAGPNQDRDNPAGVGGLQLHEWHWHAGEPGHEADAGPRDELMQRRGAQDPIEMQGGTTFYFVTEGFDAALEQAMAAAADRDVDIAGGAATVR